jgi:hypothetical protein
MSGRTGGVAPRDPYAAAEAAAPPRIQRDSAPAPLEVHGAPPDAEAEAEHEGEGFPEVAERGYGEREGARAGLHGQRFKHRLPREAHDLAGLAQAIYQGNGAAENRFQHGMRMLGSIRERVHSLSEPNSLSAYLADILQRSLEPLLYACYNVYKDSSVILLASGIALAVNYFGAPRYPVLAASSDTTLAGSVALAKLIGTTFLFKSALEPFVGQIVYWNRETRQPQLTKTLWHQRATRYFNPLALALIVSYAQGWNVKPLEGTLYSAGLFALMKLLGKGFDYVCNSQDPAPVRPGEEEGESGLDVDEHDEAVHL